MNITPIAMERQFFERLTLGNKEAQDWLNLWGTYIHWVDDIIDEDVDGQFILNTFAMPIEIYTHPFFLKHGHQLRQLIINCTNAYADCVAWEKTGTDWQQGFTDHYRHFGCELGLAVAYIVGGWQHMRSVSLELRTACWVDHHDKDQNAT